MPTAKSFNDLSSTAKMLVTFQKQSGRDLREVSSGMRETANEHKDKIPDLTTILPAIKFEREIAATRLDIIDHDKNSNSLRSFLNSTKTHIGKLKTDRIINDDKSQELSEPIKKIEEDLTKHENNLTILGNSFLKLCEERWQVKRTNNLVELEKIEKKLRDDLLPNIKESFKEEEKLRTRILAVHNATANAAKARGVIISPPITGPRL